MGPDQETLQKRCVGYASTDLKKLAPVVMNYNYSEPGGTSFQMPRDSL